MQLELIIYFLLNIHEGIHKEIRKLDYMKASPDTDILLNIIKKMLIFSQTSYFNYSKVVSDCEFPTNFKNANFSPIQKKDSILEEENHRPISILPNLSKIYERIMNSQINAYLNNILPKYPFSFRQSYSSQQCLLVLIKKWKKNR